MSYQSLAFFTGLFGSLHCVVMCGPLVMSIPFQGSIWYSISQKIVYQCGRIATYAILGFIAGSIGGLFNILGLQQAISFISGIVLLLIAYYQFRGRRISSDKLDRNLFSPLANFLGRWMSKPYGGLFAGILHGLIPCGMVYMAIAGSLNVGSAIEGSEFMVYFGLGTTPLLMMSSFLPLVLRKFRAPQLLIGFLFLLAGLFLIARSLNLYIPYITSPVESMNEVEIC